MDKKLDDIIMHLQDNKERIKALEKQIKALADSVQRSPFRRPQQTGVQNGNLRTNSR